MNIVITSRTRRCPHEIIAQIINSAKRPTIVSDIVFDSRTNFKQANVYIEKLIQAGLIKKSENINGYRITNKGMQYLDLYKQLQELLK